MTAVDVVYRYGQPPSERAMLALSNAREVYGVRKFTFDEKAHTLRVEYDATRLDESEIASLLRGAGFDLTEKLQLT